MIGNTRLAGTLREAMRLMRAGDLRGATAAIQRQLAGSPMPMPPQEPMRPPVDEVVVAPPPDTAPGRGPGRFLSGAHHGPAGTRAYKLFIPPCYQGRQGQPLPLIVMLHGCTQDPDDFAAGTRMNEIAAERDCFVVYPEQPRSANPSRCWNWFSTSDQRRGMGEPGIIANLVRELTGAYAIDPARVYVAGLSAGGAMAVILGRTHPELFAAVGVHSGLPFGAANDVPSAFAAMRNGAGGVASQPERAIPTIVFHGDRDPTVHPVNAEQVAIEAAGRCACDVAHETGAASADARTFSRKLFKDADGTVVVESWTVHGGGHQWSGGDPRGSHTDPTGPDASREMVRFFLERSLR